jgi:hypothetical protein
MDVRVTMVTKKVLQRSRPRRARSRAPTPQYDFDALRRYIEVERSRLADAEAMLDCVAHAMEADERVEASGTRYPSVVRIARNLLNTAIDRLDSIYIRSALEHTSHEGRPASDGREWMDCDGVKECRVRYLH